MGSKHTCSLQVYANISQKLNLEKDHFIFQLPGQVGLNIKPHPGQGLLTPFIFHPM